jgi:hypothetical protein
VYKISRNQPWPPHIDLSTARETLSYIHDDMKRVPELQKVAAALEEAMREMDRAEATSPRRMGRNVITASRFMRFRH